MKAASIIRGRGRPPLAEASDVKSIPVVFRCTPAQKEAWVAAGGAKWLRKLLERRAAR